MARNVAQATREVQLGDNCLKPSSNEHVGPVRTSSLGGTVNLRDLGLQTSLPKSLEYVFVAPGRITVHKAVLPTAKANSSINAPTGVCVCPTQHYGWKSFSTHPALRRPGVSPMTTALSVGRMHLQNLFCFGCIRSHPTRAKEKIVSFWSSRVAA